MLNEEDTSSATSDSYNEEVQNFPSTASMTTDSPPVASSMPVPVDPWTDNSPQQQHQPHVQNEVDDSMTPKPAITTTKNEEEETQEALTKLKRSSKKLTSALHHISSDIDGRIGLSIGVGSLGNSVRQVNESHQVSTKVSKTWEGATSTIGGWFSNLDQRLAISDKTKTISSSINQSVVQPLSNTTKDTLGQSSRAIQQFDQTHGITRTTATTLATGAEFLADSANAMTGRGENLVGGEEAEDDELIMDETQATDNDGLPSSFQRDDTAPDVVDV